MANKAARGEGTADADDVRLGDLFLGADEEKMRDFLLGAVFVGAARARRVVEALPARVSPDLADDRRITPLICAAANGQLKVCEVFVQAGADPRRRDIYGRSAAGAFASECRSAGRVPPPAEEWDAALELFAAAAGPDAESPAEYHLTFGGDREPDDDELGGRLQTFYRQLDAVLTLEGLPVVMCNERGPDSGRVWLLPGEEPRLRRHVTRLAREHGLSRRPRLRAAPSRVS